MDFYVPDAQLLIQAAYDLIHPETRENEIRSCMHYAKAFDINKAMIVTRDTDEEIQEGGVTIQVVSVWKWLLR